MGKTCLYTHLERAKALFPYINLQVADSIEWDKPMQNFSFGGAMPSRAPCRYVAGLHCYGSFVDLYRNRYGLNFCLRYGSLYHF